MLHWTLLVRTLALHALEPVHHSRRLLPDPERLTWTAQNMPRAFGHVNSRLHATPSVLAI